MLCLNLGCGARFHHDWINIDFVSTTPAVLAYNLLLGIPYPDNHFDVVYHSHVLEHFTKSDGKRLIKECFRVLKPDGIIRIVVPDLEEIAKQYLKAVDAVVKHDSQMNSANYDWSVIELLDQMVREKSGGEMASYWSQREIINETAVESRVGTEFKIFREGLVQNKEEFSSTGISNLAFFIKIKNGLKIQIFKALNVDPSAISIGKFRNGGECHKWMYDRYSLYRLLLDEGFRNVKRTTPFESSVPDWWRYLSLDVDNGKVRKPDSLFMEATK